MPLSVEVEREVDADREGHDGNAELGLLGVESGVDGDDDDRDGGADADDQPGEAALEDAVGDGAHQVCLRGGELVADAVAFVEEVEDGGHRESGDEDADAGRT